MSHFSLYLFNAHLLKDNQLFRNDILKYHLNLLNLAVPGQKAEEACLAPILSTCMLKHDRNTTNHKTRLMISQIGLLARLSHALELFNSEQTLRSHNFHEDPQLLFNVSSPSSTFICGSQGSGKSHTLSCMLKNCLILLKAEQLPNSLTGVVFHYDAFISDMIGSSCEAAFLSSHLCVEVRVLCSPTNIHTIHVRDSLSSKEHIL